jgi:hypothetical protein
MFMRLLIRPRWMLALVLGLGMGAVVLADGPGNAPPATEADPFSGREWELTPYLKGTAPQIRDKMNGEMERLIAKIKETQESIRIGNADAQSDEKLALDKLHKNPVYQKAAAEKAAAEADLETARKGGSAQDRMDASSRFNKARLAIETMEHDAVANNEALSRDHHAVFDAQKDLKRYTDALTKATAWRDQLLDATRNGFMLRGPLAEGSKGTLPRVTVEKVVGSDAAMVGFDLITFDMSKPPKDHEGIKEFPATKARIHVLVTGIDVSKLKAADKLSFDRVFVVRAVKKDAQNGTVYEVKPFPADADKLFEMIVPLRDSLPAAKAK